MPNSPGVNHDMGMWRCGQLYTVMALTLEKTCPTARIPMSVIIAGLSLMSARPCFTSWSFVHFPEENSNEDLIRYLYLSKVTDES